MPGDNEQIGCGAGNLQRNRMQIMGALCELACENDIELVPVGAGNLAAKPDKKQD